MTTRWIGMALLAALVIGGAMVGLSRPGDAEASAVETAVALTAHPAYAEPAQPRRPAVPPAVVTRFDDTQVRHAYGAVAQRRTALVPDTLAATRDERAYLAATFTLLDQAVAVRVFGAWRLGDGLMPATADYDALIDALRDARPSGRLLAFHTQVIEALTQQRAAFAGPAVSAAELRASDSARRASASLREAAAELRAVFPAATAQNQAAFGDTLAALDLL